MTETNKEYAKLPQYDRKEVQTAIGFYKTLFHLHDVNTQGVLPAIVEKFDRTTRIAECRPLVCNVSDTANGESLTLRPSYSVRVIKFAHGGFELDTPVFVGDTGWLIAGDRNAKTALEKNATVLSEDQDEDDPKNEGVQRPDDLSLANFQWGFFIPDSFSASELANEDGIVLKKVFGESAEDDDHAKIQFGKDKIYVEWGTRSLEIAKDNIIIASGDDKITINDDGIGYDGTVDRVQQVVTDVMYDEDAHQLKKKIVEQSIRGDLVVKVSAESDWNMIIGGQAEQNSVEE